MSLCRDSAMNLWMFIWCQNVRPPRLVSNAFLVSTDTSEVVDDLFEEHKHNYTLVFFFVTRKVCSCWIDVFISI